jgi:maleate cis-trans isomerase
MKIGLIALSTDLTIERDFHKYCSHEVYTTRIIFKNPLTPENLSLLQDQIKDAKLRFPFEMDRYVFGCTSGTAYKVA